MFKVQGRRGPTSGGAEGRGGEDDEAGEQGGVCPQHQEPLRPEVSTTTMC